MTNLQNARDYVRDKIQQGLMTTEDANIEVIRMVGVMVVSKLPRDIRNGLNKGVKDGRLGRLKKDGLKPEIYHHVNSRANAIEEQRRIERKALDSLRGIFA